MYTHTRHNIGFRVGEHLSKQFNAQHKGNRCHAHLTLLSDVSAYVALPQTYMNESGKCVQALMSYYKWKPYECLVVVDELDLPFGKLRLKQDGSAGTHNGLKSIVSSIGTQFIRLRIGIGPKPPLWDSADFVLSKFSKEEETRLPDILERSSACIHTLLTDSLDKAMNQFN